jgi:alkylhydroperoxidase family enzyme
MLNAWRESPLYNARERAALAWTEALSLLAESHAPDEDYQMIAEQFSTEEQFNLTLLIVVINGFNRIGVGFRMSHPATAERQAA